jgi:deoxyribonuclease V
MSAEWKARLIACQEEMRPRLIRGPGPSSARYIAGCDLTVEGEFMVGGFVVVDVLNSCKSLYEKCTLVNVDIPYIPGLLSFREGPVILQCLREFNMDRPDIQIDALLVDGSGQWHMRRFGLACYVGIECGLPTLGVSKKFLATGSSHNGKQVQADAQIQCPNVGDVMMLHHELEDGPIECAVMRTTESVPFKPIFISPGNRMDTSTAIEIVRSVCKFREPEPLRLADRISRSFVKTLKTAKGQSKH